ncbi:MAG: tyrosine-protein phosphatase [Clostridia bacterium]|nr:tyrosine-protein phosphatase [Clostridia bacterium]
MATYKRLPLKNIINCRDLGGYPCDIGVTEFGRFIRCAIPETPDKNDIVELLKHGVNTVIDLRDKAEAQRNPSVFKFLDGVDYHHICLLEFNPAAVECFGRDLEKSYEYSIEHHKADYKKALEAIADAKDGCIMYHCYFGKDRTGLLSVILLHIAGACIEDIIADYQVSYTYLLPFIQRRFADDPVWSCEEEFFKSEADVIAQLIAFINGKYGDINGYLKNIGISDETVAKIKKRFF